MTSFIGTSTFGRHALRTEYEGVGGYFTIQLLNVPPATPGDRSTWTWASNWGQYAIPGAYSSGLNALQMLSSGGGPGVLELWEEATSPGAGAYYANRTSGSPYALYTNTALSNLEFTHVAVFTMQTSTPVTTPATQLSDDYLAYVYPYFTGTEEVATLAPNQGLYNFFVEGYVQAAVFNGFSQLVDTDEALFLDLNTNPPATYTYPYIVQSLIYLSGENITDGYYSNKGTSLYVAKLRDLLLEINSTNTSATFLAELLNVTGATPDFEEGWTGWAPYRINRYAFTTTENKYKTESKEDSYSVDLGLIDPEYAGIIYTVTWQGIQMSLKDSVEFYITPPSSGSFTFTHIAVFLNEGGGLPTQGTTYTYSNTDRLVGVIELDTPITMTTSSTARAYPFNFGFTYQPTYTYTITEPS